MARPAHSLYVRLRGSLAGARRLPHQYKASHEAIPSGAIVGSDRVRLGRHKSDLSSQRNHNFGYPVFPVNQELYRDIRNLGGPVQFQTASPGIPGGSGLAPTGLLKDWVKSDPSIARWINSLACSIGVGTPRRLTPSPSIRRITDRDFMAVTLKKVSTGAGVFHQQTIVFRWAAASIGCGHFDSWHATDGRAASLKSAL